MSFPYSAAPVAPPPLPPSTLHGEQVLNVDGLHDELCRLSLENLLAQFIDLRQCAPSSGGSLPTPYDSLIDPCAPELFNEINPYPLLDYPLDPSLDTDTPLPSLDSDILSTCDLDLPLEAHGLDHYIPLVSDLLNELPSMTSYPSQNVLASHGAAPQAAFNYHTQRPLAVDLGERAAPSGFSLPLAGTVARGVGARARSARAYSPYPESSSSASSPCSSQCALDASKPSRPAATSPRNRQVTLEEFEAAEATLVGWACPFCDHVQKNRAVPDFLRHRLTHSREAAHNPKYARFRITQCCGVPLEEASAYGIDPKTARQTVDEHGVVVVGGCGTIFSRNDALRRHLRNDSNNCVGDGIAMRDKRPQKSKPRKRA